MTVYALENHFMSVDEYAIIITALITVSVFDGAESKLLPFYMQRLSLLVFQGECGGIEVGLLCVP